MPSHRKAIVSALIAALLGGGLLAAPALAGKGARVRAASKNRADVAGKTIARAGKNKRPAARGRNKSAPIPAAASAPAPAQDERDVTPAAPPAGTTAAAATPAKARVYTFGGLDVTGNLKAPQMLFFRGRVQQELDTSSPEKRSFLKELEKTADAKGL